MSMFKHRMLLIPLIVSVPMLLKMGFATEQTPEPSSVDTSQSENPGSPPTDGPCRSFVIPDATSGPSAHICIVYPYAFHGSYTSYYALRFENGCTTGTPVSYDGPNGMSAYSSCPQDCEPDPKLKGCADGSTRAGYCCSLLLENGLGAFAPTDGCVFAPAVKVLREEPTAELTNGLTGESITVKCYKVRVHPSKFLNTPGFQPPFNLPENVKEVGDLPVLECAVGHQVKPASATRSRHSLDDSTTNAAYTASPHSPCNQAVLLAELDGLSLQIVTLAPKKRVKSCHPGCYEQASETAVSRLAPQPATAQ